MLKMTLLSCHFICGELLENKLIFFKFGTCSKIKSQSNPIANFLLNFHNRLPFDMENPVGYVFGVAMQCALFLNSTLISICSTSFVIAAYMFLSSLTNDIKDILQSINKSRKLKRNRLKSLSMISELIEFHSSVVQLSVFQKKIVFLFFGQILIPL